MIFEGITRKTWERYERNNALYQAHPFRYRLKLCLLLFQSLIAAILIFGGILALVLLIIDRPESYVKLAIFLGINLIITIISYYTVLRNKPWREMLYLSPESYPHFYRKVNWIASLMKGPRIHRIYVSNDFNAAVSSTFIFLPVLRRNVLIIGYPMLCALSSKAIIAVLAHEIGHIAKGHLSLNNIFYHIELFWESLHLGVFDLLVAPWRNYFLKSLSITLHPLHYAHEKEADKIIADRFGEEYQREGLVQSLVKGKLFDNDKTLLHAIFEAKFIDDIDFAAMNRSIARRKLTRDEWQNLLDEALREMPPVFDEHPPFKERIGFDNVGKLLPYLLTPSDALEKLLSPGEDFDVDVNDYYWRIFADSMEDIQTVCKNFATLQTNFNPDAEYPVEEVVQYVEALEFFDRAPESELLIEKALKAYPDSQSLRGIQLLRKLRHSATDTERHEIIAAMEKIIRKTPLMVFELNDPLMEYYLEYGMNDRIKDLLALRQRSIDKECKRLGKELEISDNLRPAHLLDNERESLKKLFVPNAALIEAVYPVERVYDNHVLLNSRFVVIRKRHRPFALQKNDKDLVKDYEDMDFHVVIGSGQMLWHLESLNVEPILIEKK